jgi:hypothetical protein
MDQQSMIDLGSYRHRSLAAGIAHHAEYAGMRALVLGALSLAMKTRARHQALSRAARRN